MVKYAVYPPNFHIHFHFVSLTTVLQFALPVFGNLSFKNDSPLGRHMNNDPNTLMTGTSIGEQKAQIIPHNITSQGRNVFCGQ